MGSAHERDGFANGTPRTSEAPSPLGEGSLVGWVYIGGGSLVGARTSEAPSAGPRRSIRTGKPIGSIRIALRPSSGG